MVPARLRRIVDLLARLPGVGEKTATRFALHLVTADPAYVRALGEELLQLPATVQPCARCGFLADVVPGQPPTCSICADPRRDPSLLCVVGRAQDLMSIERSGAMRGRYFVLGRLMSPLEGIGPEHLRLDKLRDIVSGRASVDSTDPAVREVLCATPPSVDGEATALLLARELEPLGARVTRIASGVPHGGDLEFADQVTLGRAIEGRRTLG